MTTPPKTISCFEQLLSEIYARWPHENNQKVCIDCLKPRSNKNKFRCKNCGCTEFYVLDYQNSFKEIILKKFHFIISPSKNQKLNV